MWISRKELNELRAELKVSERLLRESEKQTAYAEAKLDSQEEMFKKLEIQVKELTVEKKELLEELLIVSGVKMSKYQEAVAQKQLEMEGRDSGSFSSQTRQWAHEMTQNSMISQEERNRRAIELVNELEREALNNGGLGDD